MGSQQFCLKWNNHQTNLLNVFEQLLQNEAFVDVTLACEGLSLKAHKMVLSACSPYFQGLFLENPCKHPIVILNSIKYSDLKAIIDFMYKGEVNVSQEQLSALLKTAELLKVKGLAEVTNQTTQSLNTQTTETISSLGPNSPSSIPSTQNSTQPRNTSSPPPKRKKLRSSVASSAANSPQTPGSVTNNSILNQPKNMPSDPSTVALDIKSEPHVVPVVAELSQEEHSTNHDRHLDQNTDQPPDLTLERSPEIVDDHSSLSNVTADMAYDHSSADYSGQDHSGPPDITPSVQAVPSTSGMQSSTQGNTFMLPPVKCELFSPFIAEKDLLRLKEQRGNIKQFATALAKLLFTREERQNCNTYSVGKRKGLDPLRVNYLRRLVFETYQVPSELSDEAWSQCVIAINAHCRYLRWKERFDMGLTIKDLDNQASVPTM